jgi:hypothetical protein
MSYDIQRTRGRVAAAATAVVKKFAVNYKTAAEVMGVKPTEVRLPLSTDAGDMDLTFVEFAEFLGELVDNVRDCEDESSTRETAEVVLAEMQAIVVRGLS